MDASGYRSRLEHRARTPLSGPRTPPQPSARRPSPGSRLLIPSPPERRCGHHTSEREWAALVASGRQAEHQALEILRRPLDEWEARLPESLRARRWAVAVLAGATMSAADAWRESQLEAIRFILAAAPPRSR